MMWGERVVQYPGSDESFAVRWLKPGCAEESCVEVAEYNGQQAGFVRFDTRVEAARLYNRLIMEHPHWRVEVFFGLFTWHRFTANHDDVFSTRATPMGIYKECLRGDHLKCPSTTECACQCHTRILTRT